ncbi:MAG: GNAT family protein [Pseudomonadota bacterium]
MIFLEGKRLYLRGLEEGDANGNYPIWLNNESVCRENSHHIYPYTREDAVSYIRSVQGSRSDLVLAIVLKTEQQHIGNIALQSINQLNRSADLSILIGEMDAWGQGYAKEAAKIICYHGFEALNLRRISSGTFASNIGMQRVAESLGMLKEGIRRKMIFKNGDYQDVFEYGILKDEFMQKINNGDAR